MRTAKPIVAAVLGVLVLLPAGRVHAGVCDPTTLASSTTLCYGDGGLSNPDNVAGGTFTPTTPFVQGSQVCFSYDVTADIEHGGYDRVYLRLTDNLGGQQELCLAGADVGDCSAPIGVSGGCENFAARHYDLAGTACYTPQTGATQVTARVYVAPIDLAFQCGDDCTAGGDLGVVVNQLRVIGCNGLSSGTCGNHTVDGGEQCDDGNGLILDGCDQQCHIEPGAICSVDGRSCAGQKTCRPVIPGSLTTRYCYTNASDKAESTLRWTWKVRASGQKYLMFWDVEGGVELFKNGEYDSLWMTWEDDLGGGETFFLNDGGLFQTAFYETWSRASRAITPTTNATSVTVTVWVQSDANTSCATPKAGKGPFKELYANALTLTSCGVTAQRYDTLSEFTEAMGGCYIVHDFNTLAPGSVGPFSGDGYTVDVDTNEPAVVLTADDAPYYTTQASGDGTVALEAQGYGDYESNSRLRITFTPKPAKALGMNVIDAGDGNGVMAVEAYRDGRLVFVDNDIQASADPNNYITWKGLIFSEPVDSVVLFMIEGGDFFNIDNLVLTPQLDGDQDGVPNRCDCAPDDPAVAGTFTELCDDGIDNDCDLLTDGGDPDCGGTASAACGVYADEQLTSTNGGWLTSGNQAWRWEPATGLWRAVSAHNINAVLETAPFQISQGACDEVFKVTVDYGGSTEANYDLLVTTYSVNGGPFMTLDTQSGNLAPRTHTLPASVAPGDKVSFRFRYTTDNATLGTDPSVSRVRIFSDADQDNDGACDACDCAPNNGAFAEECDADGDGYCSAQSGTLNADATVAGCAADTVGGGVHVGTDCNDGAATANPGHATETGYCSDGLDNDCDGPIDGADLPDCAVDDCVDNDGDGYGSGTTCAHGPDCDDTTPKCTTDCSDSDQDGIADCKDGCIDRDHDGYGVGPECAGPDCDDAVASCNVDCSTDADSNGIADCYQDCIDADGDNYGVGTGCNGADCDDTAASCTTDCSDADQDGIADCKDDCIDRDGDHYGVGPGCVGPDCNDAFATCTTDCVTDTDGGDGNGVPDCEEDCQDADNDGYGVGVACAGPDCDDTLPECNLDCADFDGDHVPDCADPDDDNDGLSDVNEGIQGTDPRDPDSDDDGLLDGQEVNNYGTDPLTPDSDGDGLDDGPEVKNYGTDPTNPDTDGEGLSDGDEVKVWGTDPNNADTDGGGMDDFNEVRTGRRPVDFPQDDGDNGRYQGSGGCTTGGGDAGPWALILGLLALVALRRRRAAWVALIGVIGVGGAAPAAQATGPEGFSVQNFVIKPGADRIFSVEGSEVAPAWAPYGGLWFHYVENPLDFVVETPGQATTTEHVIQSIAQLHAGVGIGLFDLAELELVLPISIWGKGDATQFPALTSGGVGDLLVRLRMRLLGRDATTHDGVGLNLGVAVGIPTGAKDAALGDGGVTIQPKLAFTVGAGPLLVAVNAGVNIRTEAESFRNIDFGQELLYGLGVQVDLIPELAIGAEIFGRTQLSDPFGDATEGPLELAAGPKVTLLDGLIIEAGAGLGLTAGYGSPDWRVFAGLSWAQMGPGDPDSDGDGLADSVDQCPSEPEDFDKFGDDDGCPDLDNDQDGVPDVKDRCPMDPEDIDGFEDDDGCPDSDNDQDGLPDTSDGCPDQAEDKDGFQDADGCPDPDNDGDGILDGLDGCINEPETVNEYQDDDGCPDTPPLARVEGCRIIIGDAVYFKTGKATIDRKSYALLDEVARIIGGIADFDHVFIEGHTDDQGSAGYNRGLSDRRAKAVRKYLIRKGIGTRKLKAKGFGEDKPIAPNDSDEGRAKNRRVEFKVVGGTCAG
ncbi:MAG: hypothetical protein CVU56_25950 [Deltaproteobacteria bacterium HGW-Deltaproteobacteria-14]|jgi:MYXO-CTERM domain-containing protein|nr:MAG: hypothetical protein CVU56_25950 [Deltaproteobacteria bacterium HGW-Deltaproteobacteria-14]